MDEFGRRTGWLGREKHVLTLLSFLLDMVEHSKFEYNGDIVKYLNLIFEYFERVSKKNICYVAGSIAGEKWRKINAREN